MANGKEIEDVGQCVGKDHGLVDTKTQGRWLTCYRKPGQMANMPRATMRPRFSPLWKLFLYGNFFEEI